MPRASSAVTIRRLRSAGFTRILGNAQSDEQSSLPPGTGPGSYIDARGADPRGTRIVFRFRARIAAHVSACASAGVYRYNSEASCNPPSCGCGRRRRRRGSREEREGALYRHISSIIFFREIVFPGGCVSRTSYAPSRFFIPPRGGLTRERSPRVLLPLCLPSPLFYTTRSRYYARKSYIRALSLSLPRRGETRSLAAKLDYLSLFIDNGCYSIIML